MTHALSVFDYRGQNVRIVTLDGEPWFVAADACGVLDLTNSRMVLDRLDDDEKGVSSIDTLGGPQEMAIVNEPGLYSLILGSRKPEAKAFKRWVTHEVLPAIRKTGAYVAPEQSKQLGVEDLIILQAQSVKELKGRVQSLEGEVRTANARINTLDALSVDGDPRQQLNGMVRKLALKEGVSYRIAWHQWKTAYNTAFRTNLRLLMMNYRFRKGLKHVNMVDYLEATERLADALRVADKLLNAPGLREAAAAAEGGAPNA